MTEAENTYYRKGVPFFIEVEFTDWTNLVERKLIDMGMEHSEILPGLKVNRVFKQTATEVSATTANVLEDLNKLIEGQRKLFNEFLDKYTTPINAEENKKLSSLEIIKDNQPKLEDRPVGYDTDRIRSYDDVTQFPTL